MNKITSAQIRKIHALSRERGLDSETLHSFIYKTVKKDSIKSLSITEAVKVIDCLQDGEEKERGMATKAQLKYICGLMVNIGWTDGHGKPDMARFRKFIKNKFKIEHEKWLTVRAASDVIEAFKEMSKRDSAKENC